MDYARIAPMMGRLWSPLAAVTASWQGRDNAQMCLSIGGASIVPDVPRVVVHLYKTNLTHEMVVGSKAFALCFLRQDQQELVHRLGFVSGRGGDKVSGLRHHKGVTGSPVLEDCWGYLDCAVIDALDGGDMTCFLAEVLDGRMVGAGEPLSWHQMRQTMPRAWHEEWDRKITGEIAVSRKTMRRAAARRA
ncbi:MAG: flavin reductase [SAR202 cluster bacterium]|nr:flavin reductase [SAR202 cluster bacterium]